jgi:transposase
LWTTQARCPQAPQVQQQQKKRTTDVLQNADIFTRYGHWFSPWLDVLRSCWRTGVASSSMPASMSPRWPEFLQVWSGDDSDPVGCASLGGGRTDGHAAMHEWACSKVQEALRRDPHAGDLFVFRGVRGNLIKILWHDGLGMSLYAKRPEKGRFIWPSPADGVVGISPSQLAYRLDGIDWMNPVHTFRPERAGSRDRGCSNGRGWAPYPA